MKKMAGYHIFILTILTIYILDLSNYFHTKPDLLAILGLDIQTYDRYNMSILNALHLFIFILLIIILLFYSIDKLNQSSGLYEMMVYRTSKKVYFLERLKMIIKSVLMGLINLYSLVILYEILLNQFLFDSVISDVLFLLKFGFYICILLLIYERSSLKIESNIILIGQLAFTIILIIGSQRMNIQLLNYSTDLVITIVSLLVMTIIFILTLLVSLYEIRKGDLS